MYRISTEINKFTFYSSNETSKKHGVIEIKLSIYCVLSQRKMCLEVVKKSFEIAWNV